MPRRQPSYLCSGTAAERRLSHRSALPRGQVCKITEGLQLVKSPCRCGQRDSINDHSILMCLLCQRMGAAGRNYRGKIGIEKGNGRHEETRTPDLYRVKRLSKIGRDEQAVAEVVGPSATYTPAHRTAVGTNCTQLAPVSWGW